MLSCSGGLNACCKLQQTHYASRSRIMKVSQWNLTSWCLCSCTVVVLWLSNFITNFISMLVTRGVWWVQPTPSGDRIANISFKDILRCPVKLATLPLPMRVRTQNSSRLPFKRYFLTVHRSAGPSSKSLLSTMNANRSLVFCELHSWDI